MERHRTLRAMSDKKSVPGTGFGIAAIICAFLCFPLGVVFAIIALVKAPKGPEGSTPRVMGIVTLAFSLIAVPMCAAISIPNFIRYQNKSKQVESKIIMGQLMVAQQMFYAEHSRYATVDWHGKPTQEAQSFPMEPCDEACAQDPSKCRKLSCLDVSLTTTRYAYACQTSASADQVTCAAVGDLDGDGQMSVTVWGTAPEGAAGLAVAPPQHTPPAQCDWQGLTPNEVSFCDRTVF